MKRKVDIETVDFAAKSPLTLVRIRLLTKTRAKKLRELKNFLIERTSSFVQGHTRTKLANERSTGDPEKRTLAERDPPRSGQVVFQRLFITEIQLRK